MSKISKACDISPKVRREVTERDEGRCIVCGSYRMLQVAHYIPRSLLGLGIPQNLGLMCARCHFNYDNGFYHKEYKNLFRTYLMTKYPEWDESKLIYSKRRAYDTASRDT
jgi:hypothetical protein